MIRDTFTKALERYTRDAAAELETAAYEAAEDLQAEAQDLVPVVTGALHDSAITDEIDGGGRVRFQEDYATDVHEDPDSAGFSYLMRAVDNVAATVPDEIAIKVKQRTKVG